MGNGINGLNSLYASILGFLAVAELGVGSAITFCMYRPIVEGDKRKVSALYWLFTRLYLMIGGIILVTGCILLPLLPVFAKDYTALNVNLYLTFVLSLIAVVITYLFSAKTSLINAYKNDYITTIINSSGVILQHIVQIVVLIRTRSFVWFLVCAIGSVLLQWGVTELVARHRYGSIIKDKQPLDPETKHEVRKSVYAMFMHKIGGVLVNTADSIIISAFLGVVILGYYSNYIVIMSSMVGVISLFFTPLTSVIGHLYVEESSESVGKYLNFFHTFNFCLGVVFFLGYYGIIDNLVTILFDKGLTGDLVLGKNITLVITLNYFIQFLRQTVLLFRDATGTFYQDRYKPLIEGTLNVGLSIGFVYLFGLVSKDFSVVGVIAATIVTNLLICHIVEPHVLYKYALKKSAKRYYLKNYFYIFIFAVALAALHFSLQSYDSQFLTLLVNGFIAVAIAIVPCFIAFAIDQDFRHYIKRICSRICKKLFGKKSSKSSGEGN